METNKVISDRIAQLNTQKEQIQKRMSELQNEYDQHKIVLIQLRGALGELELLQQKLSDEDIDNVEDIVE